MSDPFRDLPKNHYSAIVADPPWRFKSYTALQTANPGSRRDVERHYSVLGLDDIKALPVRDIAAKDCHLFLWTTAPCLRQAFDVIAASRRLLMGHLTFSAVSFCTLQWALPIARLARRQ